MVKELLKRLFFAVAPETAVAVQSARSRSYSQKLVKEWGLFNLNKELLTAFGNRVLSGPFQNLILTPMTFQEHIGPFLLGTYETELHPWFESLRNCKFDQIIDVGSKFGYYAVGLARIFPEAEVLAFDTDWWARKATREMIEANGVSRVSVRGFCSPQTLTNVLRDNALILSDCEGYEEKLFCETTSQALTTATVIIELHEFISPGVTSNIQKRFAQTHSISRAASPSVLTLPTHIARPRTLSEQDFQRTMSEIRQEQEWFLLTPKTMALFRPELSAQ